MCSQTPDLGSLSQLHLEQDGLPSPPSSPQSLLPSEDDDNMLPDDPNVLPPGLETAMDEIKWSLAFIEALKGASLDDSGLDEDVLHRLRNPSRKPLAVDDPDLLLSLKLFISTTNSSKPTLTCATTSSKDTLKMLYYLMLPSKNKSLS
jgi:hypothetical protein